ncbi:helix-turn-helix domain-containing protein [Actinomadura parmotrematis]|uniref:GAF domain-containing protein n=1 Tax=Actinomadura parmotrematis TaxID=2864039 RepID=A0ABS7G0A8_9ACTN|nr:helix-turn-helix domain-containing protein [Actinomadura parmotrematis]MBW8485625.1 GAF domain-containing protein [Actinomadura parmotrematis]
MPEQAPVQPHTCADPVRLRGALAGAHERGYPAPERDGTVRGAIRDSWHRSRRGGDLDALAAAPLVLGADALAAARRAHPLAGELPVLRGLLGDVAGDGATVMVVTDGAGHVLWSEGSARARGAAEGIGLAEGTCWSETVVGTNGIGTPLAARRPEYVYAAEHAAGFLHRWSCAGAPVTDPDTGTVVGCLDVSGVSEKLHPAAVRLVQAAARLAEARLEVRLQREDERLRERYARHLAGGTGLLVTPTGRVVLAEPARWRGHRLSAPAPGRRITLPGGLTAVAEPLGEVFLLRPGTAPGVPRHRLTLRLLGDGPPAALLDGRRVPLSGRRAEILTLLALHPEGLSAGRLASHLYGDEGSPITVRAEIHRLRAHLGELLRARPYRLDCDVDADLLAVRRRLDDGDVRGAAALCAGELLPLSDAPGIRAERDELNVRLRRRVLDDGGTETLWAFAQNGIGDADAEVLARLAGGLPAGDPRRAAVAARAARLDDPGDAL